ncbi:SDR family NAD(P)-dependent oxidoreductase [Shouchella shacheensis]|uniref:SDR family NAD(P)-dependent oxidoreductase n=1 Tax=Shouchella shacheensis TaxID=1649580 RepID=UPI00073FDDB5|nr:SDR family NAD(P)-dependent oxidoreductase [Shouchella shacheensis]
MIFSNEALKDQHILITGASGGIGDVIAKVVASMGASVTITGRNESKLGALREALESVTDKRKIFVKRCDLARSDEKRRTLCSRS